MSFYVPQSDTVSSRRASEPGPLQGAWWKYLTGLLMTVMIYSTFFVARGAQNFGGDGNSSRIVFFHVPVAILTSVAYFVATIYAVKALRRADDYEADGQSAAAMETRLFVLLAHDHWRQHLFTGRLGALLDLGPQPDPYRHHVAAFRVLRRPAWRKRRASRPSRPPLSGLHHHYVGSRVFPDLDRAAHSGKPSIPRKVLIRPSDNSPAYRISL